MPLNACSALNQEIAKDQVRVDGEDREDQKNTNVAIMERD